MRQAFNPESRGFRLCVRCGMLPRVTVWLQVPPEQGGRKLSLCLDCSDALSEDAELLDELLARRLVSGG